MAGKKVGVPQAKVKPLEPKAKKHSTVVPVEPINHPILKRPPLPKEKVLNLSDELVGTGHSWDSPNERIDFLKRMKDGGVPYLQLRPSKKAFWKGSQDSIKESLLLDLKDTGLITTYADRADGFRFCLTDQGRELIDGSSIR